MSSPAAEAQFPLTAAQLSGNFCETLFFGMYLATFCFSLRTLFLTGSGRDERWIHRHEVRWIMTGVSFTLFVICTFDVAIGLLHNFHAFIESSDPEKELDNLADWINIARTANNTLAMIIGDFVLIYRCWVVYGRRWPVVVPSIIFYLGGIAAAGGLLQVGANPRIDHAITLNSEQVRPWFMAFFAITAFQNVLTTSILIWRIWRVEKDSERYINRTGSSGRQPRHLRKVIRVIAESGAAYTFMVFVTFVVAVSQSNAMYPTSDMSLQATGITFNVILVRSSARRDQQFTVFDQNERATMLEQHTPGSATLGSIHFSPGQIKTQDVELAIKSVNLSEEERSGGSSFYPGGIKVTTQAVLKS